MMNAGAGSGDSQGGRALRVAAAQDAPVFLDPRATCERILARMREAADAGVELLTFGETFLPGYPFWLSLTGGARFDDAGQKAAYAAYVTAAVALDGPELQRITRAAKQLHLGVVLGVVERPSSPPGGAAHSSVYCTAVTIDPERGVVGAHRKLVPTWEERLAWTPGDGHGLRVHTLGLRGGPVRVSALNCWENWMPQARFAMWSQAPEVHVALWPGNPRLTRDITRFAAMEARSFVVSASALLGLEDIPDSFPLRDALPEQPHPGPRFYTGGSAVAGPDGAWIVEPVVDAAGLVLADLELGAVLRERHNLDVAGHYNRPDVLRLHVDRRRVDAASFVDDPGDSAASITPPASITPHSGDR